MSFTAGAANVDYNQSVEELLKMTPHNVPEATRVIVQVRSAYFIP